MPDFIAQIRELALSFEDAVEYFPWHDHAFYREQKGCNFLYLIEHAEYIEILVRLPKGVREAVLSQPNVEVNIHMNHKGWMSVKINNQAELDEAKKWIALSYQYNKPIRRQEDLLEGESSETLMFLEEVRKLALSFGDVEEYFPFTDRAFRLRKGKIFLYATECIDYLNVTVLLPTSLREFALRQPYVEVPKYLAYKGWISAKVSNAQELDTVLGWIETSFEMNQPPRKKSSRKVSVKD